MLDGVMLAVFSKKIRGVTASVSEGLYASGGVFHFVLLLNLTKVSAS
jgi:hypothetical protein